MNRLVVLCVLVAGAYAGTLPAGLVGYSGIVTADGRNVQFTQEMADNIILAGPSGIVTRDGKNYQLVNDNFQRTKRSAGYVTAKGNIGHSGILRADGSTDLFDHDTAHNILLIGPSGIVTRDGRNMQLTDDLRIVNRAKRHTIGESGMILDDGTQVQFKTGGATILLEGPSGIIMSDGTIVQKRGKRAADFGHTIGNSGIITKDGQLFQLGHGVTVVSAGPSGAVLSDGRNIQF